MMLSSLCGLYSFRLFFVSLLYGLTVLLLTKAYQYRIGHNATDIPMKNVISGRTNCTQFQFNRYHINDITRRPYVSFFSVNRFSATSQPSTPPSVSYVAYALQPLELEEMLSEIWVCLATKGLYIDAPITDYVRPKGNIIEETYINWVLLTEPLDSSQYIGTVSLDISDQRIGQIPCKKIFFDTFINNPIVILSYNKSPLPITESSLADNMYTVWIDSIIGSGAKICASSDNMYDTNLNVDYWVLSSSDPGTKTQKLLDDSLMAMGTETSYLTDDYKATCVTIPFPFKFNYVPLLFTTISYREKLFYSKMPSSPIQHWVDSTSEYGFRVCVKSINDLYQKNITRRYSIDWVAFLNEAIMDEDKLIKQIAKVPMTMQITVKYPKGGSSNQKLNAIRDNYNLYLEEVVGGDKNMFEIEDIKFITNESMAVIYTASFNILPLSNGDMNGPVLQLIQNAGVQNVDSNSNSNSAQILVNALSEDDRTIGISFRYESDCIVGPFKASHFCQNSCGIEIERQSLKRNVLLGSVSSKNCPASEIALPCNQQPCSSISEGSVWKGYSDGIIIEITEDYSDVVSPIIPTESNDVDVKINASPLIMSTESLLIMCFIGFLVLMTLLSLVISFFFRIKIGDSVPLVEEQRENLLNTPSKDVSIAEAIGKKSELYAKGSGV